LQAGGAGSSATATVVAGRVAELQNTAIALSTQQAKLITGVLFEDNFDEGKTSNWINVNDGYWTAWQQGDEKNWVYGVQNQPSDFIPTSFLAISKNWTNYKFETEVMFESGMLEQIYIIFRTIGGADCTGYRFGGNRYGLALDRLDPRGKCESQNLGQISNYPLVSNRKYNLSIEVSGKQIRCFIDGQLLISAQDDTYPKGGISIQAYEVKWAYFDNMKAYSIP
jgi:hypothetical protein